MFALMWATLMPDGELIVTWNTLVGSQAHFFVAWLVYSLGGTDPLLTARPDDVEVLLAVLAASRATRNVQRSAGHLHGKQTQKYCPHQGSCWVLGCHRDSNQRLVAGLGGVGDTQEVGLGQFDYDGAHRSQSGIMFKLNEI